MTRFAALAGTGGLVVANVVRARGSAAPVVEWQLFRSVPFSAATAHVLVKDDAATAVALAKREGKLLLYNFTGFN